MPNKAAVISRLQIRQLANRVHGDTAYLYAGTASRRGPANAEDWMKPDPFPFRCTQVALLAGLSLALLPASHAQTVSVSGRYECATAKVQGKSVPCSAAPLILKNDGHFELRGWEGNYLVTGEWVELSDSVVRSRAKIEPGHKIVFRYRGKHGWCEMVYERRVAELGKTSLG
jgi:hypothetical protein